MKVLFVCLSLALAASASLGAGRSAGFCSWAAGCTSCHGPGGRSEAGMPSLAGRSKDEMFKLVSEMKEGKRSATVMHQIGKGYNDDELRQILDYFSRLPK
ncbi:MAG: c-type cytochrome [Comamonadaceae bacterium]|nr:c-type cytochrome [Comamonadaceae bacterium]